MTENKELKPCPFCGGEDFNLDVSGIFCNSCKAQGPLNYDDRETAWNTRPSPWNADMSAAPRDGTPVFALCFEDYPQAVRWMGEDDYGDEGTVHTFKSLVTDRYVTVTHWMPLPLPPEEGRG